jgi:hypothetical protein
MLISMVVSGSSFRASRSAPASMPSRPVIERQIDGDGLRRHVVAADQDVFVVEQLHLGPD